MSKKGEVGFGAAIGVVLFFALVIFVISFSAYVLGNIKETQTSGTDEYKITNASIKGLSAISKNAVTIGIITAVVIVCVLIFVLYKTAKTFT